MDRAKTVMAISFVILSGQALRDYRQAHPHAHVTDEVLAEAIASQG